jgi:hypothetical protein
MVRPKQTVAAQSKKAQLQSELCESIIVREACMACLEIAADDRSLRVFEVAVHPAGAAKKRDRIIRLGGIATAKGQRLSLLLFRNWF